jgi:hypothetical protein
MSFLKRYNVLASTVITLILFHSLPSYAGGGEDSLSHEITAIKQELRATTLRLENRIAELEARLAKLEAPSTSSQQNIAVAQSTQSAPMHVSQVAPTSIPDKSVASVTPAPTAPADPSPTAPIISPAVTGSNGALQIGLSGLFAAGGSSLGDEALANLQAGGHDPNRNGFTVQNIELTIGASVDPYFDAQANIIFLIDAEGETVVELEEAFFTTTSLPGGLQIKGGQFYTEFGRQNPMHPHSWSFVDQPVVLSRFFGGDGLRSQGVRAAWLLPTDWYSEVYVGTQNARGETATSFLSEEGEEIGGHELIEREARNLSDAIFSARWLNGIDLSDTLSANIGLSGVWGPNASGLTTDTRIIGADLYLKWQAARSQRGFPFVSWHTEALHRRYEAGDVDNPGSEVLKDWGMFSQALWGFKPGWTAGLRWDYATGKGDTSWDPMRDTRHRLSPNITWYPTEYSKLRLQYNRDWFEHAPEEEADSLWLQFEFGLGSHMAHKF